ncbi:hypothetical protein ACP70R_012070 [Stipagrostis hirtigluma subsp. patula]
MAGHWRSPVVAVLMVVTMVAASSMKAVAAAEEKAACRITEKDVANVVARVRNSNTPTNKACKSTVSKVKGMGGNCLCELRRRVQSHFDSNQDMFMCISPGDIAQCKKTCIITQRTVDHVVDEIKRINGFKQSVLCANTVRRVMEVGDDCFCELRSRVQAKVKFSVDDFLCATPAKISRCPRTGKEAVCSVQEDVVQYCVDALVPRSEDGLVQSVGEVVQSVGGLVQGVGGLLSGRSYSSVGQPSVQECCSKVSKQGRSCACEVRRAIEQRLIDAKANAAMMPSCMIRSEECPKKPVAPGEGQQPGCSISERDVNSVADRVRNSNPFTDSACRDTVSRVKRMGGNCLCELRGRVQAQFDSNKDMFMCISPPDIAHCPPTCIITEEIVDAVAKLVGNENNAQGALTCTDIVYPVKQMGEACVCELIRRVEAKFNHSVVDYLCVGRVTASQCRKTEAGPCGYSKRDVDFIVDAIRTQSGSKLGVICDKTMPRLGLGLPRDLGVRVGDDAFKLQDRLQNASAAAWNDKCICELRDAVQANFDYNIDRFLCQPLGYLSRCPLTGKERCELSKDEQLSCFKTAVAKIHSLDNPCCSKLSQLGDACACTIHDITQRQFVPKIPGRFCVYPGMCPFP